MFPLLVQMDPTMEEQLQSMLATGDHARLGKYLSLENLSKMVGTYQGLRAR